MPIINAGISYGFEEAIGRNPSRFRYPVLIPLIQDYGRGCRSGSASCIVCALFLILRRSKQMTKIR